MKYYEKEEKYNLSIPLKEGEYEKIYIKQDFIKEIYAPMCAGTKIGEVTAYIEDEIIFQENIYLKNNIVKNDIFYYLNLILESMFLPFEVI